MMNRDDIIHSVTNVRCTKCGCRIEPTFECTCTAPSGSPQGTCPVSNREKLDYMIETMIGNASVRTLRGRMVPKKDAIHIAKKITDLAIDAAVSEVRQNRGNMEKVHIRRD